LVSLRIRVRVAMPPNNVAAAVGMGEPCRLPTTPPPSVVLPL
jgi:hypothetical protein